MKTIITLFFTVISTVYCFSQVQKMQGIVVLVNNDTIYAEILDEPLYVIQSAITFRHLDSLNTSTLFSHQIKSVKFNDGRLFKSIDTDSSSNLLLCLIEGYYDLYLRMGKNQSKSFYLRHDNNSPILLTETFTWKTVDGQLTKCSNHEYVLQLKLAMSDRIILSNDIHNTKYKEAELISIVKKYNEYKGNNYADSKFSAKSSRKISKGILISAYPFLSYAVYPGIGMSLDISSTNRYERFSMLTRFKLNLHENSLNRIYPTVEIPIAVAYTYWKKSRIKMDVFFGISSLMSYEPNSFYYNQKYQFHFYVFPELGTGVSYRIRSSSLRTELTLLPVNIMLAYVF